MITIVSTDSKGNQKISRMIETEDLVIFALKELHKNVFGEELK